MGRAGGFAVPYTEGATRGQ